MKAYDRAMEEGDPRPAHTVAKLKLKGFYPCCIYKWKKLRSRDSWSLLCAACPSIAQKHHELPNILRSFMGRKGKFQTRTPSTGSDDYTSILPDSFTEIVHATVVSWTYILLVIFPARAEYIYIYI